MEGFGKGLNTNKNIPLLKMAIDSLLSWKKLVLLAVVPTIVYCSGCLGIGKSKLSGFQEYFRVQAEQKRDIACIKYRKKDWTVRLPPFGAEYSDDEFPIYLVDNYKDGRIANKTDKDGLVDRVFKLGDYKDNCWERTERTLFSNNDKDDIPELKEFTPRFISLAKAAGQYKVIPSTIQDIIE